MLRLQVTDSACVRAARIAAQIAAQYTGTRSGGGGLDDGPKGKDQREQNDPAFVKDIEINDLRNRYLLTKGSSQQQVSSFFFPLNFCTRLLMRACSCIGSLAPLRLYRSIANERMNRFIQIQAPA